jgi:hypothetical protein
MLATRYVWRAHTEAMHIKTTNAATHILLLWHTEHLSFSGIMGNKG